tara:strand:- start:121 stop:663 length:543 start_codon:yes stop_codon:yes gene_type:complete
MKIKNLGWYITMLILFGGIIYLYIYQKNNAEKLKINGKKTIGYCKIRKNSLLDYKQAQIAEWTYEIDNISYKSKGKSTPFELQDFEYYVIYYNPENKEDITIDYKDFVLNGNYKNTNSVSLKEDLLNNNKVVFEYYVGGKKYERIQSFELKNGIDLEKTYLVKYKVGKPEIAYIYLDSIQ